MKSLNWINVQGLKPFQHSFQTLYGFQLQSPNLCTMDPPDIVTLAHYVAPVTIQKLHDQAHG